MCPSILPRGAAGDQSDEEDKEPVVDTTHPPDDGRDEHDDGVAATI